MGLFSRFSVYPSPVVRRAGRSARRTARNPHPARRIRYSAAGALNPSLRQGSV